jgi:hypothetical protein
LLDAARAFGFRLETDEHAALLERFARGFFAPLLARGPTVIAPDSAMDARQMVADKRAMAKLGLPPHLLFVLRLRFGLYAVLAQLGARLDWGSLEEESAHAVA